MLWPDGCLGAVIIYEDRSWVLERCYEFSSDARWLNEVLLMTNNPWMALGLAKFFSSDKWFGVRKLIEISINSLAWLRGTHASKNRCIARLKKLLKILGDVSIRCGVHLLFLDDLLPVERLKEYIRVLEVFEDYPHRVRNRVHELLYPYLRSELEKLGNVILWFPLSSWRKVGLLFDFSGNEIRVEMQVGNKHRRLNMREALNIIEKIVERSKKRRERLWHEKVDDWGQQRLIECIPKVINTRG